jgi:hypothetical protein
MNHPSQLKRDIYGILTGRISDHPMRDTVERGLEVGQQFRRLCHRFRLFIVELPMD